MASQYPAWLITNTLIGIVGFLGNLFIIVIIMRFTSMYKQLANVFVINQSLIDMTSAVFLIAQVCTYSVTMSSLPDNFVVRDFFCRLWQSRSLMWGLFISSTYNLAILTLERYVKIVHPIFHKTSFTIRKAKILSICAWLGGVTYSVLLDLPTSALVEGNCLVATIWPNANVAKAAGIITIAVNYWLPICVFVVCYLGMIRSLKRVSSAGEKFTVYTVFRLIVRKENVSAINVIYVNETMSQKMHFYILLMRLSHRKV